MIIEANTYRGAYIENRFRVSLAAVTPQGQLVAQAGDPQLWAHLRSTAKPFQSLAVVLSGALERFGYGPRELAITTGSHDGTPEHTDLVNQMLGRLGLPQTCLVCGVHPPSSRVARQALEQAHQSPTVLHHNCSGKHTGMLAAALALGASVEGYADLQHPVQQLNLNTFRELSGIEQVGQAVDGCSVPTFVLPLAGTAQMLAYLAAPDLAPQKYRAPLEQIFQAMRHHPQLVAGPGSIDTVVMEQAEGVVAKRGADGYYGLALRHSPWGPVGLAIKVEDGSSVPREPVVIHLLHQLGLLPNADRLPWWRPVIRNWAGLEVGHVQVQVSL
jgi:L-asparaginase II